MPIFELDPVVAVGVFGAIDQLAAKVNAAAPVVAGAVAGAFVVYVAIKSRMDSARIGGALFAGALTVAGILLIGVLAGMVADTPAEIGIRGGGTLLDPTSTRAIVGLLTR